VNNCVGART
jgi:hypothetical protein